MFSAEGNGVVRWKSVIAQAVPIVESFISRGIVPTVRTVYYALVSKELIPNTRSAYQGLVKNLVKARKDGIVKWQWIADETRVTRGSDNPLWEPEEYAKAYVDNLFERLEGYELPRWLDQPYYVEVWIEKFALAATFHNWIGGMNVVLVPSRGYSSWTFIKDAALRMFNNLYDKVDNQFLAEYQKTGTKSGHIRNDKKAIILYFGDFDPSGKDIERFLGEALEWFGLDVEVKGIAVNQEQIEAYDLPTRPEDAEERAKLMRDPRFKKWEHGFYRVELDALMAFVPDEFERIIKNSVAEYFDEDIYSRILERQDEETETVWGRAKELLDEKMKEFE